MPQVQPYSIEEVRDRPYLGKVMAMYVRQMPSSQMLAELGDVAQEIGLTAKSIDEAIQRMLAMKKAHGISFPNILAEETNFFDCFTFELTPEAERRLNEFNATPEGQRILATLRSYQRGQSSQ